MQAQAPVPFAKEAIITRIFVLFLQHHLSYLHAFAFLSPPHSSNVQVHILIFLLRIFFHPPLFVFKILLKHPLISFSFFSVLD